MKKIDVISGALIVLFGLALIFIIIPIWVPTILEGDYGLRAKDMPNVAAFTVTGLGLLFLYTTLFGSNDDTGTSSAITPENWRFLLKATIFLIIIVSIFQWVGFLAAGPITIGGFMLYMGERRPIPLLATALCAPLVIWLFFWQLLRFPLP